MSYTPRVEKRRPYVLPVSQPSTPADPNARSFSGAFLSSLPPTPPSSPEKVRERKAVRGEGKHARTTSKRPPVMLALIILLSITSVVIYAFLPGSSTHIVPQSFQAAYLHTEDKRPRAALISLVRNSELPDLLQSMSDLETRFNNRTGHHYPWIFFNEEPFSDEFKHKTAIASSGNVSFALIPKEHWSIPRHIDLQLFMDSLEYHGAQGVGKAYMESYRHMCRWNSGFFFQHPILQDFDWYWRVEPDVRFWCDIEYDPFAFLQKEGKVYGFNMNILDDARSFPALWKWTKKFIEENPEELHEGADLRWIIDLRQMGGSRKEGTGVGIPGVATEDEKKRNWDWGEYNGCQFFSNFEIGNLNFFRSERYMKYFNYLDQSGGFFYERWGDAPIHTLALTILLPKNATHYFNDIGYTHGINTHCPKPSNESYFDEPQYSWNDQNTLEAMRKGKNCACKETGLDEGFYKLVAMESAQRKPDLSCLRMWLEVGEDLPVKKTEGNTEAVVGAEPGKEEYFDDTTESMGDIAVEGDKQAESSVENVDKGKVDKEKPNSARFEAGGTVLEEIAGTRQENKGAESITKMNENMAATRAAPTIVQANVEGSNNEKTNSTAAANKLQGNVKGVDIVESSTSFREEEPGGAITGSASETRLPAASEGARTEAISPLTTQMISPTATTFVLGSTVHV